MIRLENLLIREPILFQGLQKKERKGNAAEKLQKVTQAEKALLSWQPDLFTKKQAVKAETGLTLRLNYISREIMEPNRTECQFFEAGYLEAQGIKNQNKV